MLAVCALVEELNRLMVPAERLIPPLVTVTDELAEAA